MFGFLVFVGMMSIPSLLALAICSVNNSSPEMLLCWIIIFNAAFILLCMVYEANKKVNNTREKEKMIERQKRQEKYDNEYGVIDFKEKE